MTATYDAVAMTDGSCGAGGDQGAWAAVVVTTLGADLLHGTEFPSTNNRCELMPIIRAIGFVHETIVRPVPGFTDANPYRLLVLTDSEHVQRGYTEHHNTKSNPDLWAALRVRPYGLQITMEHVDRNSTPGNHMCDILAGRMRAALIGIVTEILAKNGLTQGPAAHKEIRHIIPEAVKKHGRALLNQGTTYDHAPAAPADNVPTTDPRFLESGL